MSKQHELVASSFVAKGLELCIHTRDVTIRPQGYKTTEIVESEKMEINRHLGVLEYLNHRGVRTLELRTLKSSKPWIERPGILDYESGA